MIDCAVVISAATSTKSLNCIPIKHSIFSRSAGFLFRQTVYELSTNFILTSLSLAFTMMRFTGIAEKRLSLYHIILSNSRLHAHSFGPLQWRKPEPLPAQLFTAVGEDCFRKGGKNSNLTKQNICKKTLKCLMRG